MTWRKLARQIVGMKTVSSDEMANWLVMAYRQGLNRGYNLAENDFFHAEIKGEPDPDWYNHRPALRRVRGRLG